MVLVAFAGEEFKEEANEGGWYKVSNARGTGWSFGTFYRRCDAERSGRSLEPGLDERVGDAPGLEPWAIGLISGIGGTVVVLGVIFVVLRRRSIVASDLTEPLMGTSPRESGRPSRGPAGQSPGLVRRSQRLSKLV